MSKPANSTDDTDDIKDGDVRRVYVAANAALNETPSPAVRAAVLAAAARAVQARPTGVGADGAAPALRGRPRYRLPLAAAASLLVGTIAVLLAHRTEENLPSAESTAVAARVEPAPGVERASSADVAAPPAAQTPDARAGAMHAKPDAAAAAARFASPPPASPSSPSSPPPAAAAPSPQLGASSQARQAPKENLAAAGPAGVMDEPARNRVAAATSERVADAEKRLQKVEAAAAALSPVVREEATSASTAESKLLAGKPKVEQQESAHRDAAAGVVQQPAAAPVAPPSDRVTARPVQRTAPTADAPAAAAPPSEDRVTARPVQRTAPMAEAPVAGMLGPLPSQPSAETMAEPARWLERIVRLRAERRHDLADSELKLLRVRYPDFAISPTAIR